MFSLELILQHHLLLRSFILPVCSLLVWTLERGWGIMGGRDSPLFTIKSSNFSQVRTNEKVSTIADSTHHKEFETENIVLEIDGFSQ